MSSRHALTSRLLLSLLLTAPSARADEGPLTLSRVLALARKQAPAVVEARTRVEAASGRLDTDSGWFPSNPELSASLGPHLDQGRREGLSASVGLSQAVSLAGQGGARMDAAQAALLAARSDLDQTTRQAAHDAASAYFAALHARDRRALAVRELETAEELKRVAERRLTAGEVSALDTNLTGIAQARAQATVAAAQAAELGAHAQLRALLALPGATPIALEGSLSALPEIGTRTPVASPVIASREASRDEARAQAREVRTDLPDVTLGVSWELEGTEQAIVGSLSVPLPVFSTQAGARTTAAAALARAEAALANAQREQTVALDALRERDALLGGAAHALATTALPLVDDTLQLSARAYAAGELSLEALLVIRRDALETRRAVLDHQLDAARARLEHALLMGTLP